MSNEQWKEYGDCEKCRKKNYCGAKCRAHNEYVDAEVKKAVGNFQHSFLSKKFNIKEEH